MKILSKSEILTPRDLPVRTVEVPEWGGAVRLRTLTVEQLEGYQNEILNARKGKGGKRIDLKGSTAKLLVLCAIDEKDEPLFTDADVATLGQQSAGAVQKLSDVAMEMNGLKESDLEELVKN